MPTSRSAPALDRGVEALINRARRDRRQRRPRLGKTTPPPHGRLPEWERNRPPPAISPSTTAPNLDFRHDFFRGPSRPVAPGAAFASRARPCHALCSAASRFVKRPHDLSRCARRSVALGSASCHSGRRLFRGHDCNARRHRAVARGRIGWLANSPGAPPATACSCASYQAADAALAIVRASRNSGCIARLAYDGIQRKMQMIG